MHVSNAFIHRNVTVFDTFGERAKHQDNLYWTYFIV